jgi:hypothetical protein
MVGLKPALFFFFCAKAQAARLTQVDAPARLSTNAENRSKGTWTAGKGILNASQPAADPYEQAVQLREQKRIAKDEKRQKWGSCCVLLLISSSEFSRLVHRSR